jgi:hypothetical protein
MIRKPIILETIVAANVQSLPSAPERTLAIELEHAGRPLAVASLGQVAGADRKKCHAGQSRNMYGNRE